MIDRYWFAERFAPMAFFLTFVSLLLYIFVLVIGQAAVRYELEQECRANRQEVLMHPFLWKGKCVNAVMRRDTVQVEMSR